MRLLPSRKDPLALLLVVAAFAPALSSPMERPAGESATPATAPDDEYFMELMAGKGDPARYSPAEFVNRSLPPTLVIQGAEDTIVLARDARSFCAAA